MAKGKVVSSNPKPTVRGSSVRKPKVDLSATYSISGRAKSGKSAVTGGCPPAPPTSMGKS